MSATPRLIADGSSPADSHPRVRIDRSVPSEKYRYTCPRGHSSWDPCGNHLWCGECARQHARKDEEIETEYWELEDQVTGEAIPYSAVVLE